jgi:hypothetical protein
LKGGPVGSVLHVILGAVGQHVRVQARATAGRVLKNNDVGNGEVEPAGDGLDRVLDGSAEGVGLGLIGGSGRVNDRALRGGGPGGVERGVAVIGEDEGVEGVQGLGCTDGGG